MLKMFRSLATFIILAKQLQGRGIFTLIWMKNWTKGKNECPNKDEQLLYYTKLTTVILKIVLNHMRCLT